MIKLLLALLVILFIVSCSDSNMVQPLFISGECCTGYNCIKTSCKKYDEILNVYRPAYLQNLTDKSVIVVMRVQTKDEKSCNMSKVKLDLGLFSSPTYDVKRIWIPLNHVAAGKPRCEIQIHLKKLKARTEYTYSASVNNIVTADDVTFSTPPLTGDSEQELYFFAMGDMAPGGWRPNMKFNEWPGRYAYAVNDVLQKIANLEPLHMGLLLGDVDNRDDGDYGAIDYHVFGMYNAIASVEDIKSLGLENNFTNKSYTGLMSRVAFYPSPGNHDCRRFGDRARGQALFANFVTPENNNPCKKFGGCGKNDPVKNHHPESYYSFDMANVHFVSLNIINKDEEQTTTKKKMKCSMPDWRVGSLKKWSDTTHGDTMIRWLKDDLLKTPRKRWKVVYFHAGYGYKEYKYQDKLFKLFAKLDVDIVLFGHEHFYDTGIKEGIRWFYVGSGGFGDNYCDPSLDPGVARFIVKGNNMLVSRFGFDFKNGDCRPDPYVDFPNATCPKICTRKWCGFRHDFTPVVPRELDRFLITREFSKKKKRYKTKIDYHEFYQWSLGDLATPAEIGSNGPLYHNSLLKKSTPPNPKQLEINKELRCKNDHDCSKGRFCWRPESKIFSPRLGFCGLSK